MATEVVTEPAAALAHDLHGDTIALVLAVTGHRNPPQTDQARLKHIFRELLIGLFEQWKAANGGQAATVLVLSGLAAGADQWAAECVLELAAGTGAEPARPSFRLGAVLPMPLELYREDFEPGPARERFESLYERAHFRKELPLVDGRSRDDLLKNDSARKEQYEQLGLYLTGHSFALIAFWDGQNSQKLGGTADTVAMKRERCVRRPHAPRSMLSLTTFGPVIHIVTPRQGEPEPLGAFQVRVYGQSSDKPETASVGDALKVGSVRRVIEELGGFNRDLASPAAEGTGWLLASHEPMLDPHTQMLARWFGRADRVAAYFQKQATARLNLYVGLVLASAIVLAIISYFPPLKPSSHDVSDAVAAHSGWSYEGLRHVLKKDPLAVGAYMTLVIATVLVYLNAPRRDLNRLHARYRAMAEALRVQIFWRLAGLSENVADHYSSHRVSDLDWLRAALKYLALDDHAPPAADIPVVERQWLHDQQDWLNQRAQDLRKIDQRLHGVVLILLWPTVFWAATKVLNDGFPASLGYTLESRWRFPELGISTAMAVLAITSAICVTLATYRKLRDYANIASRYEKLHPLYQDSLRRLSCGQPPMSADEARVEVLLLGKHALTENAEWLLLNGHSRIDAPK